MNIAKWSVSKPVAVTMRIAALVLLGAICLTKLPIDLLPKVSIPTVAVVTQWPNVAPEEMETQITRPVEQAVSSAPNINNVSSTSSKASPPSGSSSTGARTSARARSMCCSL